METSFVVEVLILVAHAAVYGLAQRILVSVYKPTRNDCDYFKLYENDSITMAFLTVSAIGLTLLSKVELNSSITPESIALGVTSFTVNVGLAVQYVKRLCVYQDYQTDQKRQTRIALSLGQLHTKYGVETELLNELMVKYGLQCFPLNLVEETIALTESQKKASLITEPEIREKMNAYVKSVFIDVLVKAEEAKQVDANLALLKRRCLSRDK